MWNVPEGELACWVARRFPDGASPQWWLSVFESLEVDVMPFREVNPNRRTSNATFAAEVIRLAVELGGVRGAVGAYWILRIAALALRHDLSISDLPAVLSPDGSARWALREIPLTREQAIAQAEVRRVEYSHASEEFYAPAGGEVSLSGEVKFSELQDVELILSALPWISSHIEDSGIDSEVRSWLELRDSL